jgi:hypothetical protein
LITLFKEAAPTYLTATTKVSAAGKEVAEFMKEGNINPNTTHCIGHSLGIFDFLSQ